jgi:hypothetical protein
MLDVSQPSMTAGAEMKEIKINFILFCRRDFFFFFKKLYFLFSQQSNFLRARNRRAKKKVLSHKTFAGGDDSKEIFLGSLDVNAAKAIHLNYIL